MPNGKIERRDIISDDAIEVLDKLKDEIGAVTNSMKELEKAAKKLFTQAKKNAKTQKEQNDLMNRQAKTIEEARKQNIQLRKERNKVNTTTKQGRKEIEKINKQIDKNNKLVKQNVDGLTKQKIGIGKYTKGVRAALLQVGVFAGAIIGLTKAVFNAIKSSVNFNKQMLKVRAVAINTKLSLEEQNRQFKLLRDNAQKLGATTSKTAEQVGKLQEEFAKLGFSTREIINATEATILLSEVTQSDLAESAVVAASTIRGFGLRAKETQRVVDVMAKSFTTTGLDLQKYSTSMANAQVAAKSTNRTLEETTAALGTIIDTGTDASKAGTDLKTIYGKLAKQGLTLNEAYEKLDNSSNKVVTAMGLVGDRAFSSLITLSDNRDKVNDLTTAYNEAEGAAQDMANILKDELTYELDLAKSAWDGFVQSIDDGTGTITTTVRGTIRMFTSLSNWLTRINTSAADKAMIETFDEAEEKVKQFLDTISEQDAEKQLQSIADKNSELKTDFKELTKTTKDLNDEFFTSQALILNQQNLLADAAADIKDIQAEEAAEIKKNAIKRKTIAEEETDEDKKRRKERIDNIIRENETRLRLQNERLEAEKELQESADEEMQELERINQEEIANIELEGQDELSMQLNELLDNDERRNEERIKRNLDRQKKADDERLQKRREILKGLDALQQSSFMFGASLLSREEQLISRKYDQEIAKAEEAGKDTTEIEKRKAKEIAQIQRKQALLNKAIALTDIAINTAIAITKVTAQTGVGAPLAIPLVIASGALQAAAVIAEPLPEVPAYYQGTMDAPGGMALVGDHPIKGSSTEIVSMPGKNPFIVSEPMVMDLPAHSKVFSEDMIKNDFANLQNDIGLLGGISMDFGRLERSMENQTNKTIKAINNQPKQVISKNAIEFISKGGLEKTKYIDNRYRLNA